MAHPKDSISQQSPHLLTLTLSLILYVLLICNDTEYWGRRCPAAVSPANIYLLYSLESVPQKEVEVAIPASYSSVTVRR